MSILEDAWEYLTTGESWTGADGPFIAGLDGSTRAARDSILGLAADHAIMTVAAVGLAAAVAMPVGLWLGHVRRGGAATVVISNVSRAIPTIALLMLFATLGLGFGNGAAILAVAIFTVPPILSAAYSGMLAVDPDLREAARGQGMNRWQLITRLELPLAWPEIASGLRVATVQAIATLPLAALVAGGGLGVIITQGFATQRYGQALAGAVIVASVSLGTDWLLGRLERALTPAPLRARALAHAG